jgi:hypothetical protein
VWYAKDKKEMKFNPLFEFKPLGTGTGYTWIEEPNGKRRKMNKLILTYKKEHILLI